MSPTTDRHTLRRSRALRSKITTAILSGGAVLALVAGMATHATDNSSARTATPADPDSAAPGTSADRWAPAAVPAPSAPRGTVTVPHATSRGSGG
ncbi:hypothetical protein M1M07_15120 [Rhodococcus sp. HM1]|uniref:hypothetical protein n=1 Tax=unclassified Rhodococcus (in: high G+C Gram-positive bacteria) TaxID=192944 RepID=UPI0018CCA09B|nr:MULTISPECIES: hypothetical protein [unclassified Rhodococcus (in: high G+C Gram-positive bacteria)]MBH0119162.1 hypothetical protein [Rhodococcus sp. CX]MCK8672432.1 hypothetical protein [Rhodococcus sp. HM1]